MEKDFEKKKATTTRSRVFRNMIEKKRKNDIDST